MSDKTDSVEPITEHITSFMVDGSEFSLACHKNLESIQAMQSDWQSLSSVCIDPLTYFQTYEWCISYCQIFANDFNDKDCPVPSVYVVRKNGKAILIWPLMSLRTRVGASLLNTFAEPLGQYGNFLFDPSSMNLEIGRKTWDEIKRHTDVDAISLNHFPAGSLIEQILASDGYREDSDLSSSVLDLQLISSWDKYERSLSRSQRKERTRRKRKLNDIGELSFETYTAGTSQYQDMVKTALKMKCRWLEETGRGAGLLADNRTSDFLVGLKAENCNDDFTLSGPFAHALLLDGAPLAVELGFVRKKHYYSFLGAIDWEWRSYGPGKVQIEMAQRWAHENGLASFDFLHDPSDYKSSWSNQSFSVESRNVPLTWRGKLYCILWKTLIRPRMKAFYGSISTQNRSALRKLATGKLGK